MIAVDELLRQRAREGKPIRVGLVGAGAAARMIAVQLLTPVDGIRLVAIANRAAGQCRAHLRGRKDDGVQGNHGGCAG